MTAREGNMGNCHPEKINVNGGEAEVSKQSGSSEYLCLCIFKVETLIRHQSESMVNCINSAQWIIVGISTIIKQYPIATFHHILGRGFIIPWVILIFIKCLSAYQNQLFYMKV